MIHFSLNRIEQLQKLMPEDSIAICVSGQPIIRNQDVHYPFRAQSNFIYLTGLNHPHFVLVIERKAQNPAHLFIPKIDSTQNLWAGEPYTKEQLEKTWSSCHYLDELKEFLSSIRHRKKTTVLLDGIATNEASYIPSTWTLSTLKLATLIHRLRLIKDQHELGVIQEAVTKTVSIHRASRKNKQKKWTNEMFLLGEYLSQCAQHFCFHQAYAPIIAAGRNACTLHYEKCNAPIKKDDLVLMDAGIEWKFYAADLTRTWPIHQKPNAEQLALYRCVLDAQSEVLSSIKPGSTWPQLQKIAETSLTKSLIRLNILNGSFQTCMENNSIREFFPHGIGHWIGLDVHDPCPRMTDDNTPIEFQANMTLTIEPGLYIPSGSSADPKWWNIGIRIEDNLYVTPHGYFNMSQALEKEIDDFAQG